MFLTPSQIGKGALMQTLFACGPADVNPQGLPPLSAPVWGGRSLDATKVHSRKSLQSLVPLSSSLSRHPRRSGAEPPGQVRAPDAVGPYAAPRFTTW